MKKAIKFIACFMFLTLTLSAFTDTSTAPVVGYRAPGINLPGTGTASMLDAHRGEYVLITFWSSGDAASRIRCNEYTAMADRNNRLEHLAVNFDSSAALFEEVVKLDNLTAGMQYHVEGRKAADISKDYHLDRGLHTFMIDPTGTIIAIDPDADRVNSLLS